jgi:hypothetical protein
VNVTIIAALIAAAAALMTSAARHSGEPGVMGK